MAGMPGKISKSGNEWSLEEIPAEEEILAAREEALGGRGGRLGGSGEVSWRSRNLAPGASVGGTTLVASNGPKRSLNRCFPEGAVPAPRPESQLPPRTPVGSTGSGLGYY